MEWLIRMAKRVERYARHPKAVHYLAATSFIEAIFFPIPPDTMLIPMVLAKPQEKNRYAFVTTVTSVLGGLVGYTIGFFFFETFALPWITQMGYIAAFETAHEWFDQWGVGVMLLAGITPIPFKVFTVAAGAAQMLLVPFFFSCLVGRAIRFYAVAWLVAWGGPKMVPFIMRYSKVLMWVSLAVVFLLFFFLK